MPMVRATRALECLAQSLLIVAALIYGPWPAFAQTQPELSPDRAGVPPAQEQESTTKPQTPEVSPTPRPPSQHDSEAKQPKRILWVIPNYRSVSANTQLPPLAVKDKFWLATQDSFDYSSFILAGALAGTAQARNSTPGFGQGAAGFGRYYWHSFADQAVGNVFTEAIVPATARQDPRYYTLGHGGGAGVSDLYYPAPERTWTKTGQKWLTQVAVDGVFNILKEFWPDIDRAVFRGHYESRPVH